MNQPEIKNIPLKDIAPNTGQIEGLPKNPRFIKDSKFHKLVQSIKENPEMLNLRELLVFKHADKYILIGGNMRFRALKELGAPEAPCKIIPPDTSLEQLKAYTIKDNAEFGEWDFEELANEWNAEEISSWGVDIPEIEAPKTEETAEDDDFDVDSAMTKNPVTKTGDIWELGDHRLVCGDSTNIDTIEALMGNEQADLYLTDPPYNVDYVGKTKDALKIKNDQMSANTFLQFLTDAFGSANTALKQGGAFYIWHADSEGWNFRSAVQATPGWTLKQCIIWNKNTMVLGRQDYQWKHEPCLYGWKEGKSHYFIPRRDLYTVMEKLQQGEIQVEKLSKDDLQKLVQEILDTPTTVINEKKPVRSADHPTMKPIPLFGRQITNSTRRGEIVLDNFGGSGTTIMACEQLGRKARTIELDPVYCDVIIRRWEEFTGKKAVRTGNFKKDKEPEKNTEDAKI